ncbi:MAG: hypothetical protein ABI383_11815, partial [Acidobacteriaceae bacterium]
MIVMKLMEEQIEISPGAVARAQLRAAPAGVLDGARAVLGRWWVAFSLSSVCVVSGHLMIKAGLGAASASSAKGLALNGMLLHILAQPQVMCGLLVYLLGTLCWMIAASQKEISFLYPLSSVNYVLVVVASVLLFSESVS